MEGLFESDKARLRPPPSFLKNVPGGYSSTAAIPATSAGVPGGNGQSNDTSPPAPRTRPTPLGHVGGVSPTGAGTRGLKFSDRVRGYEPSSKPTPSIPAREFHSIPVLSHTQSVNEEPDHREVHRELVEPPSRGREDHMHDMQTASTGRAPSKRRSESKKASVFPPAGKPSVRVRSPQPPGRAKLGPRVPASASKVSGKRRPTELEQSKEMIEKLKATVSEQKRDITMLEEKLSYQQNQYEEELNRQHEEAQQMVDELSRELDALELQKNEVIARLEGERNQARADVAAKETELVQQKKMMQMRIDSITEEANSRISEYEEVIRKFQEEVARLEGIIHDRDETIVRIERERDNRYQQYEEYLMIGEKSRAELHNALVELKGNIRVFARVRPMLEKEVAAKGGDPMTHFEYPEGTDHRGLHVVGVQGHQSVMGGKSEPTKTLPFTFNKVFGPRSTQEGIFDEVAQLVQSALDGYRVCMFAYGQTGSGKTFTMEGPDPGHKSEHSGMIARSVNQIFENTQWKSKQTGFTFRLLCSFIEIYNETIHDLLNAKECYSTGPSNSSTIKHEVRIQDGEAVITGVHEEEVTSQEHVYELLKIANENRKTAGTKMNERASRSHSVFIMKIRGWNEATRQEINGQLNLIDLAGSERLAKSQAEGDRLRETQHINKSLACLGDVIAALAKGGDTHVPFRQSKLTHLLQPSMTNASKTLMFVNINPVPDHLHESLCSLRFAAKVNSCEIGIARRKVANK